VWLRAGGGRSIAPAESGDPGGSRFNLRLALPVDDAKRNENEQTVS